MERAVGSTALFFLSPRVGSGYTYDAAGNMTLYNTFNAENQLTYQSYYGVTYLYDGDGRKVKNSGGYSGTRLYWYDEAGHVLAETDGRGREDDNYVYFAGVNIAKLHIQPGPTHYSYYIRDHLGTTRMITDQLGNVCLVPRVRVLLLDANPGWQLVHH